MKIFFKSINQPLAQNNSVVATRGRGTGSTNRNVNKKNGGVTQAMITFQKC